MLKWFFGVTLSESFLVYSLVFAAQRLVWAASVAGGFERATDILIFIE